VRIPAIPITRWNINADGYAYRDGYVGIGDFSGSNPGGLLGLGDANTWIGRDPTGSLIFSDANSGQQTLSNLAAGVGVNPELEDQVTDVQNSLDGYAIRSVENQRWTDSSQQRQDLRNACDGYSGVVSAQGADGYVAFFTGPDAIAGDNDLFWDRANNRLGLHTSTPETTLHVKGAIRAQSTGIDESEFLTLDHDGTDGYIHSAKGVINLGNSYSTTESLTTGSVVVGKDANSRSLEVEGEGWFKDKVYFSDGIEMALGNEFKLGSNRQIHGSIRTHTTQTPTCTQILPANTSRTLQIIESNDYVTDFKFPQQTNPTVAIQSANATNHSQRLYFAHNQTDGYIVSEFGGINLATRTGAVQITDSSGGDSTGRLLVGAGSQNYPAIGYTAADDGTGTGIYFSEASKVEIGTNGTRRFQFGATNISNAAVSMAGYNLYSHTQFLNLGTVASTSHSLVTGDVLVGNDLEVDGYAYFDGGVGFAQATTSPRLLVGDGTVSAPAIAFANDDDGSGTGFYRGSANAINVATNGVYKHIFSSSGNFHSEGDVDGSNLYSGTGGYISIGSRTKWTSSADGIWEMGISAGTRGVRFDTASVDGELTLTDESGGDLYLIASKFGFGSTTFYDVQNLYLNHASANIQNRNSSGTLKLNTQSVTAAAGTGAISIFTGAASNIGDYDTGAVNIYSGDTTTDGDTGPIILRTGVAGAGAADAGDILFQTHGTNTRGKFLGDGGEFHLISESADESGFLVLSHNDTDGYIHSAKGTINLGNSYATTESLTTGSVVIGEDTNGRSLEVSGLSYWKDDLILGSSANLQTSADILLGTDVCVSGYYSPTYGGLYGRVSTQTPDTMMLTTGTVSESIIIAQDADIGIDLNFPQQTNPTVCIQSANAANNSQRLYLAHNQTDGYIVSEFGGINLATRTGDVLLTDSSGANFGLLQLGGTTSSYPAIKRSAAAIHTRLADDSDYCNFVAGEILAVNGILYTKHTGWIGWATRSKMYSPADGNIYLTDLAGTDFGLLQFGGITSSYPALKRVDDTLEVRLADDSTYTNLRALDPVIAQDVATKNYVDGIFDADEVRTLYVGKHGNDGYDGQNISEALLTIGAAITAASALTPTAAAPVVIRIQDAGVYTETITIPQYVHVYAPNAKITDSTASGIGTGTVLIAGDSSATFREIEQTSATILSAAVFRTNTAGTGSVYAEKINLSNQTIGIFNGSVTGGVLIAEVTQVYVDTGWGVGDASSAQGHTHINIEDIYIEGNSGTGISRFGAGSTVGRVDHILEMGSPTTTLGLFCNAGSLDMTIDTIDMDTAWNIAAGGTLRLFSNHVAGTRTNTGTVSVFALDEGNTRTIVPEFLALGDTTSEFPAIKKVGRDLHFRHPHH